MWNLPNRTWPVWRAIAKLTAYSPTVSVWPKSIQSMCSRPVGENKVGRFRGSVLEYRTLRSLGTLVFFSFLKPEKSKLFSQSSVVVYGSIVVLLSMVVINLHHRWQNYIIETINLDLCSSLFIWEIKCHGPWRISTFNRCRRRKNKMVRSNFFWINTQ